MSKGVITFRAAVALKGYGGIVPGKVYRDQHRLCRVVALAKRKEAPMVVYQHVGEQDDQVYVAHLDEFLAFKNNT